MEDQLVWKLEVARIDLMSASLRRSRADDEGGDLIDRAEGHHSQTPDQMFVRQQQIERLTEAVEGLPTRQREAFMLRCWDGMSTALTAECMGCTEGSVKTHYSRAMHSLRHSLEDYWNE